MFSLDISNIEIQVAIISGTFTVISALIAALAAAIVGQKIANRRKLEEKLELAIKDISFLLEVEKLHCQHNKEKLGESRKNKTRDEVRNSGLEFSGKLTPGRVRP